MGTLGFLLEVFGTDSGGLESRTDFKEANFSSYSPPATEPVSSEHGAQPTDSFLVQILLAFEFTVSAFSFPIPSVCCTHGPDVSMEEAATAGIVRLLTAPSKGLGGGSSLSGL